MYFLYTLAIIGYAILLVPRLLYDAVRHGKHLGTLRERWGWLPATINPQGMPSIWIHAVSVGEVLATGALIPALRDRYPDHPLWLSTTTQTGRAAATGLDGVDGLFYFPFDLSPVVARVLERVRPQLFVMVDTELWPTLLRQCRLRGVKTMLVNGRISDRSYPRYRLVRPFFRHVLAGVDRCCAQSEESGRRLIDLGAPPTRITGTGNLKFDTLRQPDSRVPWVRDGVLRAFRIAEGRTVVMAASTHAGEEAAALRGRLDPRQLLHAGTVDFDDRGRVARLLQAAAHAVARHGAGDRVADQQPPLGQVQFGDDRRQLLDNARAGDYHPRQDHRARRARFHEGRSERRV